MPQRTFRMMVIKNYIRFLPIKIVLTKKIFNNFTEYNFDLPNEVFNLLSKILILPNT